MSKVDKPINDVNFNDDDKDFDDAVYEALRNAKQKFIDTIEDYYYDPAYCDINFTAFIVDASLTTRLRKIEIEDEIKEKA